jgi:hypothetical protein
MLLHLSLSFIGSLNEEWILEICVLYIMRGALGSTSDKFYVQYSVHHGSVYQDDGRPHDTVTVPDVAYAVKLIDLLMMDTERVRHL